MVQQSGSLRVTPNNIKSLEENEVFVFGSNTSGRHGKGAAKQAMRFGAKYGQGAGMQGHSYGIPTVNARITEKLTLNRIGKYVDGFISCATSHNNLRFLVTRIGTGLAGWTDEDIAPLFERAAYFNNIYLPQQFWNILIKEHGVAAKLMEVQP
jgi:hypothetical protein